MSNCLIVEITNPGGLVSAITPKDFGTKSHSLNPLVFGSFERINMVEQVGSGISRIKDELKKHKLSSPEFKLEGMFSLILKRPITSELTGGKTSGKTSGKTTDKILDLIQSNGQITIPELALKIGITERSIERNIAKLKGNGMLERIGSDKGGYGKIIEE